MSDVSKKNVMPRDLQAYMFNPPNLGWAESGDHLAKLLEYCQTTNSWSFRLHDFVLHVYSSLVIREPLAEAKRIGLRLVGAGNERERVVSYFPEGVEELYGTLMYAAAQGYLEPSTAGHEGHDHGTVWQVTDKLIESWVMHQPNTF